MSTSSQAAPSPVRPSAASLAATLYEQHQAALLRFAVGIVRDPEGAEDLAQDAFLRLLVEIDAGRTPDNVRAWLYRVVANAAVSRGRRAVVARRFAGHLVVRDGPRGPEDIVIAAETSAGLSVVLDGLAPHARLALVLAAHGCSGAEISTAIGRSDVATRAILSRARRRLRSQVPVNALAA